MATDLAPSPADTASRVWAAVTDHLEAFARAWEAGGRPTWPLRPRRPARGPPAGPGRAGQVRPRAAAQPGLGRPLEEYFCAFPELTAGGPPCDLLYEDYHLRLRGPARRSDPADYYRRFPSRADRTGPAAWRTSARGPRPCSPPAGSVEVRPGDRLDDFDLLAAARRGDVCPRVPGPAAGDAAAGGPQGVRHRGAEAQTLAQLDHPHIVRVLRPAGPDRTRTCSSCTCRTCPAGRCTPCWLTSAEDRPPRRSGRTLLEAVDDALMRRGEVPPAGVAGAGRVGGPELAGDRLRGSGRSWRRPSTTPTGTASCTATSSRRTCS